MHARESSSRAFFFALFEETVDETPFDRRLGGHRGPGGRAARAPGRHHACAMVTYLRPVLRQLPGILLLLAIGVGGKLLEHAIVPHVEYVFWAIVIGFVIANTIGVPEIFRDGVATYEFWLKTGIVFLGARFVIGDVLKLGGVSLALVAVELAVAIAFMTVMGRTFGIKPKCTS